MVISSLQTTLRQRFLLISLRNTAINFPSRGLGTISAAHILTKMQGKSLMLQGCGKHALPFGQFLELPLLLQKNAHAAPSQHLWRLRILHSVIL